MVWTDLRSRRFRAELIGRARAQRRSPTRGEMIFWSAVRARRFMGVKFRRQHPVAQFIVDFFAPAHDLVVEIDGPHHDLSSEYESWRQRYLEALGLRVLRFPADAIEADLDHALLILREALK